MKIALAQLNYHIGNFEFNVKKIIEAIKRGKSEAAELVVFSELSVCGYPPLDLLEFSGFVSRCEDSVLQIAKECTGIAAVIGAPSINTSDGKPLYNSAYFLADGQIQHISNKGLLPNYDVFDEYRYFEPGKKFENVLYKGKKIAVSICEDIWTLDEDVLYTVCPMDEMIAGKPDFMINIAASPFSFTHAEKRKKMLKANALRYKLPLIYVNHCGGQTELIFDGGSMVMGRDGMVLEELDYFREDFRIYDLNTEASVSELHTHDVVNEDVSNRHSVKNTHLSRHTPSNKIELIHDALITGISDYFRKSGLKEAILGLSGGIDSAVVCVLAARALGKENLRVVLMPSEFSSGHSVDDAVKLAENLGIRYDIIPINKIYDTLNASLADVFKDLPFNIAEENLQARSRGVILMAFSNKFNCVLLNTSNKSELAVGYGTLYGDMCGGLSVIGDVYKTEVFELAAYINKNTEVIPHNTISKPPSAELRPDQKDTDSLPEYSLLDKVLFQYIEMRKGPEDLIRMGFEEELVQRILNLVNRNEYKRRQAPPVLRVSDKAFGMGRRMQLTGKYL